MVWAHMPAASDVSVSASGQRCAHRCVGVDRGQRGHASKATPCRQFLAYVTKQLAKKGQQTQGEKHEAACSSVENAHRTVEGGC